MNGRDRIAVATLPGRLWLSRIPQVCLENRQKAAHPCARRIGGLAVTSGWCSVVPTEGASLAAPFVHHLFRTLSLNGQVRSKFCGLPIFLRCPGVHMFRRRFANHPAGLSGRLRHVADGCHTKTRVSLAKKEGWAGCKQNGLLRLWPHARAWRPVVTPRPNRFSTAEGPVWSRRHCSRAISSRALLSAPPPTSSIARKTRASARRLAARLTPINRPARRPYEDMRNAITVRLARGGVLRSEHPEQRTAHV